jgi:hypothetical protein
VLQNEFWSRVFTFVLTATKDDGDEIDEKWHEDLVGADRW